MPTLIKDVKNNRWVYLMAIPVVAWYIIFCYWPMYGAIIAFKRYSPGLGIWGSHWVGLANFERFVKGVYFTRIIRNTIIISGLNLLFGFPASILLALLINEMRGNLFKKAVQTVSYLPHFISIMVISGMVIEFTKSNGIVNDIIAFFGGTRTSLMLWPQNFRGVYIISEIWQEVGWGSIIYLAALSSIDQQIYEAAKIDGAGRFRQVLHVTMPGILPTIIILLNLRVGQLMNVGFEKIILLYNPNTYETADVISSFVYREGLLHFNFSFSAAVGLFNSAINFALIMLTNWISRRSTGTSLW
jgi:putative aldouronate transport system permease protein